MSERKTCPVCRRVYPFTIDHFHRNRNKPGGLNSICRVCAGLRATERYQRIAADPERLNAERQRQSGWRRAHPDRVRAWKKRYLKTDKGRVYRRRQKLRAAMRQLQL